MTEWWDPSFPYRLPIAAIDPLRLGRTREPVRLDLVFDLFRPHPGGMALVDDAGRPAPCQIVRSGIGRDGRLDYASLYFLADVAPGGLARYHAYLAGEARRLPAVRGIRQLKPKLGDGFRRLDTGAYVIELCRGTAR